MLCSCGACSNNGVNGSDAGNHDIGGGDDVKSDGGDGTNDAGVGDTGKTDGDVVDKDGEVADDGSVENGECTLGQDEDLWYKMPTTEQFNACVEAPDCEPWDLLPEICDYTVDIKKINEERKGMLGEGEIAIDLTDYAKTQLEIHEELLMWQSVCRRTADDYEGVEEYTVVFSYNLETGELRQYLENRLAGSGSGQAASDKYISFGLFSGNIDAPMSDAWARGVVVYSRSDNSKKYYNTDILQTGEAVFWNDILFFSSGVPLAQGTESLNLIDGSITSLIPVSRPQITRTYPIGVVQDKYLAYFADDFTIRGYDLDKKETFRFENMTDQMMNDPSLYGDVIVWDDWRNSIGSDTYDTGIYGYRFNKKKEFEVYDQKGIQLFPFIYGDTVSFTDAGDCSNSDDCYADPSSVTISRAKVRIKNIVTDKVTDASPFSDSQDESVIYKDIVCWKDGRFYKPWEKSSYEAQIFRYGAIICRKFSFDQ